MEVPNSEEGVECATVSLAMEDTFNTIRYLAQEGHPDDLIE